MFQVFMARYTNNSDTATGWRLKRQGSNEKARTMQEEHLEDPGQLAQIL